MRKYHQAILLVTAVVSVVCLLVYRHEYNKLRYVLQVFNYFGTPGVDSKAITHKSFPDFENPMPSWQRIDDDFYVYSSYSINGREVRTIGFAKSENFDLNCNIYLKASNIPVAGVFSYSVIVNVTVDGSNEKYSGYNLICAFNDITSLVGVTYYRKGNEDAENLILSVKNVKATTNQNGTALCVSPPTSVPMLEADMISFLNYHDLVGMNHFIIYDYGIPLSFHDALKDMAKDSSPYWTFSYTVVPWNFPFRGLSTNAIKDIVEADCMHRTYNRVMLSATVTWEEYVVPKFYRVVTDLITDFTRPKMLANRYAVQVQTFCVQQQDDKRANRLSPIVLRKTQVDRSIIENRTIYISKPREVLATESVKTLEMPISSIIVNRYQSCKGFSAADLKPKSYEPSILRFAGDMQNAHIFQKYTSLKLFKDD